MVVLFLDFDGVLNSEGSFTYEDRRRKKDKKIEGPVNETFDPVCASNVQSVLDHYPDLKIVISSTWRTHFDIPWLKEKLAEYGIDDSRVIGVTPVISQEMRGYEIKEWLDKHPEVTRFVILDDNDWDISKLYAKNFIQTSWDTGFTWDHALKTLSLLMDLGNEARLKRREEKRNAKND